MKALCALILFGLLAAGILWERSASDKLRAENASLSMQKQEAEKRAAGNRDLLKPRAATAVMERSDHTELLRLRNQVHQLRAQQQEADKQRAANQRLAEEIKSGKFSPRRLADMEGAVPREKWAFSGFATPEGTVQSFLAAIVSGDPDQFVRCMTPEGAESFGKERAKDPDRSRKMFEETFGKLGKVSGFRITGTRPKGDDGNLIEVLVQFAIDGESMRLPLRRVGNDWKLGD